MLIVVGSLVLPGAAPLAAAAPPVTNPDPLPTELSVAAGDVSILAGEPGRVRVTATNDEGPDQYNASAVVVLPLGVTYVPGSAEPGAPRAIGEPTIKTFAPDPDQPLQLQQVLVWTNVADLPKGADLEVSFQVTLDDERYPVGSTIAVDAGVYANANERLLPKVTLGQNGPTVTGATSGGAVDPELTIVPIRLTKTERDDEAEVYRGPANAATYDLTVTAAPQAGSNSIMVTDLVPAQFQVTDCDGCTRTIVEVEGKVYTQLTWQLDELDAGDSVTLTYEAFIGLREITMPDGEPDGAATRPTGEGYPITNTATATGGYTGGVAPGTESGFTVEDSFTVQVLDAGIVKSQAGGSFEAGETRTFSFRIRTSEYIETSELTLTDTIPDGLCPVVPDGTPTFGTWPDECSTGGGAVSGATMLSATANPGGTFTVVFEVDARDADQDAIVNYDVRMREFHSDGQRTSAGDSFTNSVVMVTETTPAEGNDVDSGSAPMENGSSAGIETDTLSIAKTVWSNPDRQKITGAGGDTGVTCGNAPSGEYVGEDGPLLQLGDLVCFRITVNTPQGVAIRDAILSDFLPPGVELAQENGPQWSTDKPGLVSQPNPIATRWLLGEQVGSGPRFVPAGTTISVYLLARVLVVPETEPEVTGNLAKLRYSGAGGTIVAVRDDVDLTLAPPPPVSLEKLADGVDRLEVEEQDVVPFTIAVRHEGTTADRNTHPLDTVEVWDVLPPGFACSTLSEVSPAWDSCEVVNGASVVIWKLSGAALGGDGLLTTDETVTVRYQLTVPTPLSINTQHTNTAAVTRYTAPNTDGIIPGGAALYPTNPVGAYPEETKNVPEASDTATIWLRGATVDKQVVSTGQDVAGNDLTGQATIGESALYQYSVTIPARTSVFSGVLDDALPTSGALVQTGDPTMQTTPPGVTVGTGCEMHATEFRLCNDGRLLFPAVYTNNSAVDVTFAVRLPVRVADIPGNSHGVGISNVATFDSALTAGGSPVRQDDDDARLTVVEPSPSLNKTASVSQAEAGQPVTYTLTATNASGRPPLYDGVVVDCVPGDLAIQTPLAPGLSGPVPGDGSNGCPVGTQRLQWTLPGPLAAGTPQTVLYTVVIPNTAGAGRQYTNNAELAGSSLPGSVTGERTSYRAQANRTVTVNNPTLTKSVAPAVIVPGEEVTWTITATVPPNVWLYNATFIDRMPAPFGTAAAVTDWELTCGGGDTDWQEDCVDGELITAAPASDFGVTISQIPASETSRILTLTMRAVLPASATSVANNTAVSNTARLRWNHTLKPRPNDTEAVFDSPDTLSATATTTVRHPLVTVAKGVNDTTVEQGQIVTYTVTATASADPTRNLTAHHVQVVDTVPTGVIVVGPAPDRLALEDGESTASGGVWNAASRTLTWTIDELDPGAANARSFTYDARLAPAAGLSGGALTNTVRPQSWQSLPTDGGSYGPGTAATRAVTPQFPRINTVKTQVSPANPVYIGQEVTFQFVLINAGGAKAISLDAVDTLPTGWSYVPNSAQVTVRSAAPTQTNPAIAGQVLRWNDVGGAAVDLLPNEQITVSYRAVAAPSVNVGLSVAHTNTVRAEDVTDATGGTYYNNTAGSYIGTTGTAAARIALADLQVTKVANDNFVAGGTGTYTITVRNNGPDPSTGVRVTDTVTPPAGVTVLGATGTGWTCTTPVSGQFSCDRTNAADTLASGASWTLTVSAAVAADVVDGTTIPNTATVSSRTEDRTPGNNTDDATATVRARADLAVSKSGSPSPATAGLPISWTVTLVNNGPSVSRGSVANPIVLNDPLPTSQVSGIAIDSQTDDAGCAIASGTLRCEIAHDLAVGETVTVTLSGTVNDDVAPGSSIVNTATVTPVTTDPVPGNNSGTSTTPTTVQEALTITKVITDPTPPTAPTPGETITYRLEVHNAGPSIARGVYVIDTLPAGLTFDEIVSGAGWSATPGAGNTVRLELAGTLAVNEAKAVTIRAEIASSVTGEFTNTAAVSSTWRQNQDDAEVETGSDPRADLGIVKSVSPATIVAGSSTGGTYTLVVTNHGPSDTATPITVTDLLPAGMSVRGSVPTGCDTDEVGGRVEVTCVRSSILAADATWTLEIPVRVAADVTATSLVNQATVTSPTPDPDLENNTSTVPVEIIRRASLTVTKEASPDPVTAGEQVTWTIEVTNNGPSDAQSVQLTDPLDSRLVLDSVAPESANCTGTTTISCPLGTLRPGQTVELTVVTTVRSSVPEDATIANTATAASTTIDPETGEPATDSGTDEVTVTALAELTLVKTAVDSTVDAGDVAAFDLVVGNDGPSDAAADVVVTDTLPDGMTYLAAATIGGPATWDCAATGQVVSCTLAEGDDPVTLAAGTTAPTLRISATVRASEAAGTLTNTATAESPSDPDGPTDEAGVTITTHADLGIEKSHAEDAVAVAGEPFTWTLTVTNHGSSDSVATVDDPIVVRDVLPEGVTFTSGSGADASCEVTGDEDGREVVECERTTTLAAGQSLAITLVVGLDQTLSGTVTNTATVSPGVTPQPEVDLHPDSDDDSITIGEVADLTIAKEVLTESVVAGEPIDWQVTVTNLGPSDSDASADHPIRVVDTLPLGVSYSGATGEGWTCEPLDALSDGREQFECLRVTTLRMGDAPVIAITGRVGSGVQGTITNTAVVTPGLTAQPEGGETDEATAEAPVTESADLAIVKTIAADIVAGATGVYRLQITNLGPSDARSVVVTDTLPAGLEFSRALPPAEGEPAWTCEPDETDPQQVRCELAGDLVAARSITVDLEVTAEPELQGDLENVAEVSAETPDPDLDNNESSVTGTIAERADLSIVKTALGDPVVGEQLTYQLQVSNAGPSLARGVLVADLVPSQLEVVSVTAPGDWQCATGEPEAEGTPVACLLDELAVGDDPGVIEVVVLVTPDAFPAISNTAVVTAATPEDPETMEDNSSTVTSEVPPLVELGIEKELTSPLVAGQTGSYRMVVTNLGPTPDPGPITVTDELPAGLTVQSWSLDAEAGTCEGSGRLLTCTLNRLEVDESVEIELVVSVATSASGILVNNATVTSPAFPEGSLDFAEGEVDRSELAFTGGSLQALGWALVLLLAGAAVVVVVRRRIRLES